MAFELKDQVVLNSIFDPPNLFVYRQPHHQCKN